MSISSKESIDKATFEARTRYLTMIAKKDGEADVVTPIGKCKIN